MPCLRARFAALLQLVAEQDPGLIAVLGKTALFLTNDLYSRWQMPQTHRAARFVDLLSSISPAPDKILFQVIAGNSQRPEPHENLPDGVASNHPKLSLHQAGPASPGSF